MSQYTPGPYGPGNTPQEQQQQQQAPYYQQQQASSSNYGPPQSAQRGSSTAALGQMINSAMTTSKPMLNKLGKTFGLTNKPSSSGTPQHLQNYQNYQDHYQQQNPGQPQPFSSQAAQPQQHPYSSPHQSPYPPSNYATPASGQLAQGNYFPPQQSLASVPQTSQPQSDIQGYNTNQYTLGHNGVLGQSTPQGYNQNQPQGQGPFDQAYNQNQPQGQLDQGQAYQGQQSGVLLPPPQHTMSPSPQPGNPPSPFGQQQQQQQWVPPTPSLGNVNISPAQHQAQPFTPTPPQQYDAAPAPPPQYTRPEQPWTPMSPTSPQGTTVNQIPPSTSSPPPQVGGQPPGFISPPPTSNIPQTGPAEFLAELPADLGNLKLTESVNPQQLPSNAAPQDGQYKPHQPVPTSHIDLSKEKFTVPRRAVSASSLPLADPWRVADPTTELPTREFYIIADLLFDGIDRKFEPHNTGLLEASKILQCWRLQGVEDGVAELFEFNSYSAFGKMWSQKGIPHVLVPSQAALMPSWNFQAQTHAELLRIPLDPPSDKAPYPVYLPALNRAGWYKLLFLDLISEPECLDKLMPSLCGDTYKPGVLNHPDIQKHDRSPVPALAARVKLVQAGVTRVCEETAAEIKAKQTMQMGQAGTSAQTDAVAAQQSLVQAQMEAQSKLATLQMQQRMNDQMNQQMMQAGLSMSMAAGNVYRVNYGSFV